MSIGPTNVSGAAVTILFNVKVVIERTQFMFYKCVYLIQLRNDFSLRTLSF